ncbi:response regulator transcription factor [Serratia fonticola]|uniref:LuxR C-terminal-related transcriptional regulator n=1 Tax=Serratia fonticola TaxID=47917 RepID=A0ABY9PRI5_SERFO|nr:LuxR C-terminal-related transcriptional regulator [Serratia fonticola]WMT16060.1 LuxR C-terminal-related transcriptional regulator [Serratia fonticola]
MIKIPPCELKTRSVYEFKESDVFIFHSLSHVDELSFLIAMTNFAGKLIFVQKRNLGELDFSLQEHVYLDANASIEAILKLINQNDGRAINFIRKHKLTQREKSILLHTIDGMNTQSIGQRLKISTKTVYAHRRNALHKLGGRNFFEIWPVKKEFQYQQALTSSLIDKSVRS